MSVAADAEEDDGKRKPPAGAGLGPISGAPILGGMPFAAGGSGSAGGIHGAGRSPALWPRAAVHGGTEVEGARGSVLVRSLAEFGSFAELVPETRELRAVSGVPSASTGPGGVFGYLDEVAAVVYHDRFGLALRLDAAVVYLDDPGVRVEWSPVEQERARLVVSRDAQIWCDLTYRSVVPDSDIGRFVRDVPADPMRRSRLFDGPAR